MEEKNKIADELLQELGQQISKARLDEMKAEPGKADGKRGAVSVKRNGKMQRKWLKACAVLLCVLIGAIAITTVTSEAFRMNVLGFFFDEKDGYADLVPSDALPIMYPAYLPDGYKKVSEDEIGNAWEIYYRHEKDGSFIVISEGFKDSVEMSFDTETTKREQCTVGTYEAYYFSSTEETGGDIHTLLWQQDGVLVEITATLGKEEMVKIGSSLK